MKIKVKTSSGQEIQAVVKDTHDVVIGRSNKCTVVVPDEALSRAHCQVDLENGTFFVTDLGSANGVYIDGTRIEPNKKTQVNSFNQLHLGPLECSFEDDQSESPTNPSMNFDSGAQEKTVATRMIKTEKIQKEIRPKPQKKSIPFGLIFPVLLFCGVGYYFITQEEQPVTDEWNNSEVAHPMKPKAPYKTQMTNKSVSNEFKLDSEYESLKNSSNCQEFVETCRDLHLQSENSESVAKAGTEYVIFLRPEVHFNELRYQKIKDAPDAKDLVAFDLILGSDLMNKFFTHEVDQIHMVIMDQNRKLQKVFRFHPQKFVPGQAPRLELMTSLNTTFEDLNSQAFWKLLGDSVPQKKLSE